MYSYLLCITEDCLQAIVETLQVLRRAALEARKRALPGQASAVQKEAILSRAFI